MPVPPSTVQAVPTAMSFPLIFMVIRSFGPATGPESFDSGPLRVTAVVIYETG